MTISIESSSIGGVYRLGVALSIALAFAQTGCTDDNDREDGAASRYVLASVVIDPDGNRTTYVQTVESLDAGPFNNDSAIELPGNGVVMAHGQSFYVGLAEEPTWVRYEATAKGIRQTGSLSLLNTGAAAIDYGNVVIDDETAVSVLSSPPLAVVWNPTTMEIRGEVSLAALAREGYELEVWTTAAHDGLVYVPGRWSDWEGGRIYPGVSLTIIDPKAMKVVATAEDPRCASGGRVVFDEAGYAYVMGDGRNYSIQMFANAAGESATPENCLLRMAPGDTDFESDYYYTIRSLTSGLESITELETARQGSGLAFAKMFYPDELPAGVAPVDFDFWGERAHKLWRLHLADPPSAEEVQGIPFSTIGFSGSVVGGRLYTGESPDGNSSDVYETDPDTNTARLKFSMDGYFNGLYERGEP